MTHDLAAIHETLWQMGMQSESVMRRIRGAHVEIRREFGPARSDKYYVAYLDGSRVGEARLYGPYHAMFDLSVLQANVTNVEVIEAYRRRGIATALYDEIERDLKQVGTVLVPSQEVGLSADAAAFWIARQQFRPKWRQWLKLGLGS